MPGVPSLVFEVHSRLGQLARDRGFAILSHLQWSNLSAVRKSRYRCVDRRSRHCRIFTHMQDLAMSKPKYTRSEKALVSGYSKIRDTIMDLYRSAKILRDNGNATQSTSLSILALEECGKLFLFDSLLFSTKDDDYEANFRKCFGSHVSKIEALQFFPMLLVKFARADPRYNNNPQFRLMVDDDLPKAVLIFREMRDNLEDCDLRNMDKVKQKGFYSSLSGNGFATPSDAVCTGDHDRVFKCISAYAHLLDEIVSDRSINNQIDIARSVRGSMKIVDWDNLRARVQKYQEALWEEAFEFAEMITESKLH